MDTLGGPKANDFGARLRVQRVDFPAGAAYDGELSLDRRNALDNLCRPLQQVVIGVNVNVLP